MTRPASGGLTLCRQPSPPVIVGVSEAIRGVLLDRSHRAAPVMPGHDLAARPEDGQRINSLEELPRLLGL